MCSLDIPRTLLTVSLLLFATVIGHVVVLDKANSHYKNLTIEVVQTNYTNCQTIQQYISMERKRFGANPKCDSDVESWANANVSEKELCKVWDPMAGNDYPSDEPITMFATCVQRKKKEACSLGMQFNAKLIGPFQAAHQVTPITVVNERKFLFPFHGLSVTPLEECFSSSEFSYRQYVFTSRVNLAPGFYRLAVRTLLDGDTNCEVTCQGLDDAKPSNDVVPGSGLLFKVSANVTWDHKYVPTTVGIPRCFSVASTQPRGFVEPASGQWKPLPEGKCDGILCSSDDDIYSELPTAMWKPQNCYYHIWGFLRLNRVLRNKTIFILGDSTAEEISVALSILLGANGEYRSQSREFATRYQKVGRVASTNTTIVFGNQISHRTWDYHVEIWERKIPEWIAEYGMPAAVLLQAGIHDIADSRLQSPLSHFHHHAVSSAERMRALFPMDVPIAFKGNNFAADDSPGSFLNVLTMQSIVNIQTSLIGVIGIRTIDFWEQTIYGDVGSGGHIGYRFKKKPFLGYSGGLEFVATQMILNAWFESD